jgi:hypothetical protein
MYLPQFAWLALLAAPPVAERADDPYAIVRRGVRALGGEAVLARKYALRRRFKGKFGGGLSGSILTGEMLTQVGSNDHRAVFELRLGDGPAFKAVTVRKGGQQWMKVNGMDVPGTVTDKKAAEAHDHQERAAGLIALLRDKGFSLSYTGESKVAGRAVRGVKASYQGRPDVTLFFDRQTDLVAQVVYRVPGPQAGKEMRYEVTLSRYRPINSGAAEESALLAAGLKTDDASVLAFLQKQKPAPMRLSIIRALVKKLGDEEFEEREKAEKALVAQSAPAMPLLRQAIKAGGDLEVIRRAERCLKRIGTGNDSAVAAAVRLVGIRHPVGAAGVLLDMLPGVEKALEQDILSILTSLAERGNPDAALVKALDGADPARRAAARAALGKDGGEYRKKPGRRIWARGPLLPLRHTLRIDGVEQQTMEITEIQFFNRFDDREFEKP